ncbi:hypothetical protein K2X14_10250 [Acetobacter sp. TBRC 12305]|uniref:Burkholderia phage Bcep781 gp51 n=1 Tax=Acetobacter garciniae TaxID=2817435 RepID=A0A939HM43_9PROT|nr:hypothetical protein [Acetobacter garciniae]MBO1326042.1 hypothetical protein [Acetobacter garciniae]MBX0345214.1 hypothetical protein [Acetobacter garciniae]
MQTLLLDRTTWDLVLDAGGNIAVASDPYSITQDVACAVRVFVGECWYDTAKGLAYAGTILGRAQSASVFRAQAQAVALAVPGVASARCVLTALGGDRRLAGALLVTTSDGTTDSVGF